jgi:hypothetical protein
MTTPDDTEMGAPSAAQGDVEVDAAQLLAAATHDAVVIPRALLAAAGDPAAAVSLVAVMGWFAAPHTTQVIDRDGHVWVAPTDNQWWDRTRLTGNALSKAIAALKSGGFVEIRFFGMEGSEDDSSRVAHYRLIHPAITAAFTTAVQFPDATSQPTKRTTTKRAAGPVTLASLGYNPHADDRERLEGCLRLAHTLAKLVMATGGKPPAVTKSWVDEFDRMVRLDGYTYEQVENAILWSHSDDFWWQNVRSPQKLRKHFEMLREQARRDPQKAKQQISKSRALLEGETVGQSETRRDVFADQNVSNAELSAAEEEHLAKSWGMVWDEAEGRWVQPRPELPEYLNDVDT